MDGGLVSSGYTDHLTDADLGLLLAATGKQAESQSWAGGVARLRHDPAALLELLADPRVFRALFGDDVAAGQEPVPASPFLAFAVAVHRAAVELASMDHVPERSGQRQRIPLFDAPDLRDFLASAARRLFLAELLASFTRVASGRYRVRSGRSPARTQRFSELDPVRLAGLLDAVPESDRPGVYRRLGDVALFLTGVFPDYAAAHALGPVGAVRLLRISQVPEPHRERLASAPAIDVLEHLGAAWYRAACTLAPIRTARLTVVAEIADRFRHARRVLNHIADGYLFPPGNPWFAAPSG
jgi:hypothetical protein